MVKKNKPEIRFKGFTDDWEQQKLSKEVISIETGRSKFSLKENGTYEILGSTSVIGYDDTYDYDGDFLLTARVGANAGELYRHSGKVKISDNTVFIQGDNLDYIFYALLNFNIKRLSFGTGQPLVKASELKEQRILFPQNEKEKVQIGIFFKYLDNLITLHQRKCEKLKNMKKAMLEKLFPKNGSNIPEVRFRGFTDDWEQRKLGDEAIEILAGGDIDKSKVVEVGKYPIYANALTNDGIMGYYNDYFRVKAPAVTVTGRGDVGHAQSRMIDFTPVVRLLAIRSNHDSYFLENVINNHKTVVESTGVPQLTVPQLASYDISFPTNINEEIKIGEFFHNLDNLITLHQRQLEKLKNVKKSMLEKMFV